MLAMVFRVPDAHQQIVVIAIRLRAGAEFALKELVLLALRHSLRFHVVENLIYGAAFHGAEDFDLNWICHV